MLRKLPTSELITVLDNKKRFVKKCRTINGELTRVDIKTLYIDDNKEIDNSTKKGVHDLVYKEENAMPAEDNITSTKTYTEKIRGGFFGKRRSRF